MALQTKVFGPEGEVAQQTVPRPLLAAAGSSDYWTGKTLNMLGFNVTNETKTIDGETYRVIEAYCRTNFDAHHLRIWYTGGSSIMDAYGDSEPAQEKTVDVSPFEDYDGTIYPYAYKTTIYAPTSWTSAYFRAHADFYEEPGTTDDAYEEGGITFTRRGAMGKDAYVVTKYNTGETKLSSESKPVTVKSGRLLLSLSAASLSTATDVGVEESEEPTHTIKDEARFMKDAQFNADVYIGEKTEDNKAVKKSELATAIANAAEVCEFDSFSDFPEEGSEGRIYIALDENKTYRWDDDAEEYVALSASEDEAAVSALASIFTMDTELSECLTPQDVTIVKMSELLGEDVSQFPTT